MTGRQFSFRFFASLLLIKYFYLSILSADSSAFIHGMYPSILRDDSLTFIHGIYLSILSDDSLTFIHGIYLSILSHDADDESVGAKCRQEENCESEDLEDRSVDHGENLAVEIVILSTENLEFFVGFVQRYRGFRMKEIRIIAISRLLAIPQLSFFRLDKAVSLFC